MWHNKRAIGGLIVMGLVAGSGVASPVQWTVNGHWYEYGHLDGDQSWYTCRAEAQSRSWLGYPGDLATSISAAESAFIATILPLDATAWLGGYQEPAASLPADNWHWITGEAWGYTNWWPGEPNDAEGSEDGLAIWGSTARLGYWNDAKRLGNNSRNYGFVVEYVPEPGTLGMLTLGAIAALRHGRRSSVGHRAGFGMSEGRARDVGGD